MTLGEYIAGYIVLWFSLTTMWAQFSKASTPICMLLALSAAGCLVFLTKYVENPFRFPKNKPRLFQILIGVLLTLPPIIYLALTAHQEFPFSGDHDHHMFMAHGLIAAFGWYLLLVPASFGLCLFVSRKWKYVWLVWLAAAFLLSQQFPPLEFVLRYPSGHYIISAPLNAAFLSLPDFSPMLGNRIMNALACVLWLWLLRPTLIRRWPDTRALLLASAFLFQREWIYYSTTNYLEPFCLIFIFLSIEAAIDPEIENEWLAPVLAGIGCAFKEQAIFVLALTGGLAVLRSRKTLGISRSLLAATTIVLPFFAYWSARTQSGIFRKVEFLNPVDTLTSEIISKYHSHLNDYLGVGGWLALAAFFALWIWAICIARPHRLFLLGSMAIVLGSELLYLCDNLSLEYVGHPRFHLLSWPILASSLLAIYIYSPRFQKALVVTALFLIALQVPKSYELFGQTSEPDYLRNFSEQYASPLYFPIAKLLDQLPRHDGWSLVMTNPVEGHWLPYSGAAAYGSRLSHFSKVQLSPKLECRCDGPRSASMILDVYQPKAEPRVRIVSLNKPEDVRACVRSLKMSCANVITETAEDSTIVGAIGYTP